MRILEHILAAIGALVVAVGIAYAVASVAASRGWNPFK